jgi:hypothetical protein
MGYLWYPLGTKELLEKSFQQMFTNNEIFISDTAVVNLDHFSLLMLKLE